jgi:hypothetical protein
MTVLTKISEHVYWMPPGAPDRPSLCAVVGDRRTLMLDAGSSKAHAREFLDALSARGRRATERGRLHAFGLGSRLRRGRAGRAGDRSCFDR